MFNNILASAYKFYSRFKNEDPYIMSVFYLFMSQILMLVFIAALIRASMNIDILAVFGSKFIFGIFSIAFMAFLFWFYSKERVKKIIIIYEAKSKKAKIIWGTISWLSVLAPMAYFLSQ